MESTRFQVLLSLNVKNIMNRKSLIILICIAFTCTLGKAQQEILYTQYNFSQLAINPAYAGNNIHLGFTAISRKQWIGLEGSPTSISFFADAAVLGHKGRRAQKLNELKSESKKLGIGLILFNDKIGVNNTLQASLAYSFKINFSTYTRLSFGFQTGILNFNQSFKELKNIAPNDLVFQENINITRVNIGAGVIFETEHYFIGLSVPSILKHGLDASNLTENTQLRQYFISAGYLFYIHSLYKLKPNVMVRHTEGFPIQFDTNLHLLYNDKLWTGISYRYKNSFGVFSKILISDSLSFGIAYDFNIGEIGQVNKGSAEILISYLLRPAKKRIINPRNF